MLAYQIAFDLVENERQAFLLNVRDRLPQPKSQPPVVTPESSEPAVQQNEGDSAGSDIPPPSEDVNMTEVPTTTVGEAIDPAEVAYAKRLVKIKGILSGETSIQLILQFLYSHNR